MLKRILGTTLVSALAVPALSFAGSTMTHSVFNGFYLGAGLSANDYINKSSQRVYIDNIPLGAGGTSTNGGLAAGIGLDAGYGHVFQNQFYLGGELAYRYSPARVGQINAENPDDIDSGGFTVAHTGLFAARIGYLFTPRVLLYGLMGVSVSETAFHFSNIGQNSAKTDYSHTDVGATPGLGLSFALNDNLSLDARYTYTFYRSEDKTLNVSNNPNANIDTTITTRQKIQTQTVGLNINYHFA